MNITSNYLIWLVVGLACPMMNSACQTHNGATEEEEAGIGSLYARASDPTETTAERAKAFRAVFVEAASRQMTLADVLALGDWESLVPEENVGDATTYSILPPFEPFKGSVLALVLKAPDGALSSSERCVYVQLSTTLSKTKFVSYMKKPKTAPLDVYVVDAGWLTD